ncbi:MAG: helix-turn-helix domain-containing protein [Vibrio sp.]
MFRTFLYSCWLSLIIPSLGVANNNPMSVFYPLSMQEKGTVIVAKNLYLGDDGGIWIHDVHGKVMFFDGQNILPARGSVLPETSKHIIYAKRALWTFEQHQLFRTYPGGEKEPILTLPPGSQINQIGVSNGMIWLNDSANFYSYDIDNARLDTFSLHQLYSLNSASQVVINDAQFFASKWALATNVGVYLSMPQGFSHITDSGKSAIPKLYFSEQRRELLVGSAYGALIIDIEHSRLLSKPIGAAEVLSIAETDTEYWIGTENGLYLYRLDSGKVTQPETYRNDDYALLGKKIYSMVNDLQGGMWIATDKGMFYYSLLAQQLTRYPAQSLSSDGSRVQISKIKSFNMQGDYLAITQQGLYRFNFTGEFRKNLIYPGQVNDFVIAGDDVWIATEQGLVSYNLAQRQINAPSLPVSLLHNSVKRLTVDGDGRLWGASHEQLWSYLPSEQTETNYGMEWMVKGLSPAKITVLAAVEQGIVIGTEHGAYTLFDKQIRFDFSSHRYGEIVQVVEDNTGHIWLVGAYGVFQWQNHQPPAVAVELVEENIQPRCIAQSAQGMWLISSQGITLYQRQAQLSKHFAAPYGLISNEFILGACAVGEVLDSSSLIMGSQFGVVQANTQALAVSNLPNIQIMFSQVSVNHQPKLLGYQPDGLLQIAYDDAISFQFGALSSLRNPSLEYKLNDEREWQRFDWAQLNFDRLLPGEYRLKVRSANPTHQDQTPAIFDFEVLPPWYLSPAAIIGYVMLLGGGLSLMLSWRTRVIVEANRQLKNQVELKTSQLHHQTKIVQSSNQQLRKLLQVHHNLFGKVFESIDPALRHLSSYAKVRGWNEFELPFNKVKQELTQLHFMHRGETPESQRHDLNLLMESALKSWQEEYNKAEIQLVYRGEVCLIEIRQFNLDILFNVVFTDAIRRLAKQQQLSIQLEQRDSQGVLIFSDHGAVIDNFSAIPISFNGTCTYSVQELVQHSGGELRILRLNDCNVLELAWPLAASPITRSFKVQALSISDHIVLDDGEKKWLRKVNQLIEHNYNDSDFTTSRAAQLLFVSERSLQRRFKAATGKTFKESLNQMRLEKACQSLLCGARIAQVAFDCGFNDPSYFSQRFKHHFGLSPSQFIEDQEDR